MIIPSNFDSPVPESAYFIVRHRGGGSSLCKTTGLAAIAAIQSNLVRRFRNAASLMLAYHYDRRAFNPSSLRVNGRIDDATLKALWIATSQEMAVTRQTESDPSAVLARLATAAHRRLVTPLVVQAGLWLTYGSPHGASVPGDASQIGDIFLPAGTILPRFNRAPPVPLIQRGISITCREMVAVTPPASGIQMPAGAIGAGWTTTAKRALRRAFGRPATAVLWDDVPAGQIPPASGC